MHKKKAYCSCVDALLFFLVVLRFKIQEIRISK